MSSQTEAARADLRIAGQYIEEWKQAKEEALKAGEELSSEVFGYLQRALSYINQARQKDPAVTLQYKITAARNPHAHPALRGEVAFSTPDAMEAHILLLGTVGWVREREWRATLEIVISELQRSISLDPLQSEAHVQLAYAYAYNHERKKAVAVLDNAIQKFPDDFRVRSTMDYLQSKSAQFAPPKELPPADPPGDPPADQRSKTRGGISLSPLSFGFLLFVVSSGTLLIFGTTPLEKTAIGGVMVLLGSVSLLVSMILIYFGIKEKIQDAKDRFFGTDIKTALEKQADELLVKQGFSLDEIQKLRQK